MAVDVVGGSHREKVRVKWRRHTEKFSWDLTRSALRGSPTICFAPVMNDEARQVVVRLGLVPLPAEGGFFRPTWQTSAGSAIWFLLTPEHFSALHRLNQDEIWHFYAGDRVTHVSLDPGTGNGRETILGANVLAGESPQHLAPAGQWQGARLLPETGGRGWALVGCTLAPPWDERGFELGQREKLVPAFPRHAAQIMTFTR